MSTTSIDLNITDYTEKSFVVRGDTMTYKNELKTLGGKWNSRLKDGAGWIFPKSKKNDVKQFIEKGEQPKPLTSTRRSDTKQHEETENASLNKKIDVLTTRLVKMEKLLQQLVNKNSTVPVAPESSLVEQDEKTPIAPYRRLLL